MARALTLSLVALLATAAPALAGGIGCDVTLDKTTYTPATDGLVTLVVELTRADFDCSPSAYIESDPQLMGPVLVLERQVAKGKWTAVKGAWQQPKGRGPQKTQGTPFRLDWAGSLKTPRKAKLPPGIYRVRAVMTIPRAPDHPFVFTSKPFTVFAQCKKTAFKPGAPLTPLTR